MQGYALGDGWVHYRYDRFKLHVYDAGLASKLKRMQRRAKKAFNLSGSVWHGTDGRTGTPEWIFEIGGEFATKNLDMSLLRTPDGLSFLAGLWDADGSWSLPDPSHPMGQARFFGGWHAVYMVKHALFRRWDVRTGAPYVATFSGHTSRIGDHVIITRNNVYGTIVKAKSMRLWIDLVGRKMLLKVRGRAEPAQSFAEQN
jgi:hypothetical protein